MLIFSTHFDFLYFLDSPVYQLNELGNKRAKLIVFKELIEFY